MVISGCSSDDFQSCIVGLFGVQLGTGFDFNVWSLSTSDLDDEFWSLWSLLLESPKMGQPLGLFLLLVPSFEMHTISSYWWEVWLLHFKLNQGACNIASMFSGSNQFLALNCTSMPHAWWEIWLWCFEGLMRMLVQLLHAKFTLVATLIGEQWHERCKEPSKDKAELLKHDKNLMLLCMCFVCPFRWSECACCSWMNWMTRNGAPDSFPMEFAHTQLPTFGTRCDTWCLDCHKHPGWKPWWKPYWQKWLLVLLPLRSAPWCLHLCCIAKACCCSEHIILFNDVQWLSPPGVSFCMLFAVKLAIRVLSYAATCPHSWYWLMRFAWIIVILCP